MICFLIELWIDCVDFLMDAISLISLISLIGLIGLIGLVCVVYLALLVYVFILFPPLKKSALALASAAQKKTEPWRNAKVLLINAQ